MMLLYRLLYPLVLILARGLSLFHPKLRQGFLLRKTHHWRKQNPGRPVLWIHCASGEFEYAKPVLRLIKENHPQEQVLVTYFSPSVHQSVCENTDVDLSCPMPIDRRGEWTDFIKHYKPRCLLIARTDLWPEMIAACRRHEVPSLLFSATVTKQSRRTRSWIKDFYAKLFTQLTEVFCVSSSDADILKNLNSEIKTTIAGDTRFDQVRYRLQNPKRLDHFTPSRKKPADIVLGSTWPEDEIILFEAFTKIEGLKAIIAPHEPTPSHLEQIESNLKKLGFTCERYSQLQDRWKTSILVVDQVGILAELYTLAPMAFVGGSFKKTVHSVMEPLASGAITLVGPMHRNNREALTFKDIDFSTGLSAVKEIKNSAELADAIRLYQVLEACEKLDISEKIKSEVAIKSGASQAVLDWIHRHTLVKSMN